MMKRVVCQIPKVLKRRDILSSVRRTAFCYQKNSYSCDAPGDGHLIQRHRRQQQQQYHRYFSKSSKPSLEDETTAGATVTLQDREDDFTEPNEEEHPESSLEGERDLYTMPVTIRMPDMGEGNQNIVEEWYKQPGDIIKHNDVLCDITTPDFTFGMVTDDEHDAIMGEILVEKGIQAPDNAPICIVYHPEKEDSSKSKETDPKE